MSNKPSDDLPHSTVDDNSAGDHPTNSERQSGKPDLKKEREQRLAAELRANLRRRKSQTRGRRDSGPARSGGGSSEDNQN